MTTFRNFNERNRDIQDGIERHVWRKLTYMDKGGAVVTVKGTGTEDVDAVVLNTGHGFNLDDNSNTEVFLVSNGSDMAQKFAILTIPRDKQRKWKAGTGGVQNPLDPDKAIELNAKRAWSTDPNFAVGQGILEVKDGKVYIRGDLVVSGSVTASRFIGPDPTPGSPNIPGFEE